MAASYMVIDTLKMQNFMTPLSEIDWYIDTLTHCGLVDLRKWAIFNTILTSPKSWLSQEDLDAGYEH